LNRNKKSITVDLKDEGELARLKELICTRADVVIQNLRPGTVEKLGLDAQTLRTRSPQLIYCNLGAFGRVGPLADRPGYDPLMQAYGGIMSVTGEEGRPPVRVGVSLVDMGTGMWAVIGITSALHQRARTQRGCDVDVSLLESALAYMTVHIANFSASGELPARLGSGAVITAPYQAFRTRDGFIVIAAANANLFRRCVAALDHPEWADDPRFATNEDRLKNKPELVLLMEAELECASTADWTERLERAGVPCAPIQNTGEVLQSSQVEALGIVQAAGGPLKLVGLPISFDGERPPLREGPPKLGEHNQEIFGQREKAS
jgi:crotonobetainyl-CoA:carnitine CoA-transferase CaiB-like acyl-CoA transferase